MFKAPFSLKRRKLLKIAAIGSVAAFVPNAPALADWRTEMGVFRVGISSFDGNHLRSGKYDVFRSMLKNALDMPVEIFQAHNAAALIDAMASSRIEYAIMPAAGFATLDILCSCAVPVAAPVSQSGANAVRSVLIVDQNRIARLSEIHGKKIAVGPPSSLTASMLPYAFFKVDGKPLSGIDAQIVETSGLGEAISMFGKGQIEGFFAWEFAMAGAQTEYENRFLTGSAYSSDAQPAVAWRSEPVRFGPHVVRSNLPEEVVDTLSEALLSMHEKIPLAYDVAVPDLAGGLSAVTKSDYDTVKHMVRVLTGEAG